MQDESVRRALYVLFARLLAGPPDAALYERLLANGLSQLAAAQGVELPYSCKAGVCATCRTHVRDGEVRMDINYGLEPWEVEAGYVLACQSHPVTETVTLDYDKI